MHLFPASLLLLCTAMIAIPASAVGVHRAGQRFAIEFDGRVDGRELPGLSARAEVEVVAFEGDRLVVEVSLANEADAGIFQSARAAALGFDVDVPVAGVHVEKGAFPRTARKVPLGPMDPLDICVGADEACGDDTLEGIGLGRQGTTRLTLFFEQGIVRLQLTRFTLRWLGLTAPTLDLRDAQGLGEGEEVAEAPVVLLLLAVALAFGGRPSMRSRVPRGVRPAMRRQGPPDAADPSA